MALSELDSFADAIRDLKTQSICSRTKATRVRVASWRRGDGLPSFRFVPALAELLRMDVADLTRLIATDDQRRIDRRYPNREDSSS